MPCDGALCPGRRVPEGAHALPERALARWPWPRPAAACAEARADPGRRARRGQECSAGRSDGTEGRRGSRGARQPRHRGERRQRREAEARHRHGGRCPNGGMYGVPRPVKSIVAMPPGPGTTVPWPAAARFWTPAARLTELDGGQHGGRGRGRLGRRGDEAQRRARGGGAMSCAGASAAAVAVAARPIAIGRAVIELTGGTRRSVRRTPAGARAAARRARGRGWRRPSGRGIRAGPGRAPVLRRLLRRRGPPRAPPRRLGLDGLARHGPDRPAAAAAAPPSGEPPGTGVMRGSPGPGRAACSAPPARTSTHGVPALRPAGASEAGVGLSRRRRGRRAWRAPVGGRAAPGRGRRGRRGRQGRWRSRPAPRVPGLRPAGRGGGGRRRGRPDGDAADAGVGAGETGVRADRGRGP